MPDYLLANRLNSFHWLIGWNKSVSNKGAPLWPFGYLGPLGPWAFLVTRLHNRGLMVYEEGASFALLVLGQLSTHFFLSSILGRRQTASLSNSPRID